MPTKDELNAPQDGDKSEETSQDLSTQEGAAEVDKQNSGEDKPQDPETSTQTPHPHKLERDLANRERTIKDMNAQIEEQRATIDELKKQVETLVASSKQDRMKSQVAELKAAGCIDPELAQGLLDTYESIDALKEAKGYLFTQKPISTGGTPTSASQGMVKSIKEGLRAAHI